MNDAFLPKAWHNLPADEFFPDHFGVRDDLPSWVRQGIDESSECDDRALEPAFTDAASRYGCRAIVRATYVDTTATLAATIAVVVVDGGAESLYDEFYPGREHPGHLVRAFPVPDTPAAGWADEGRGGVDIAAIDHHTAAVQSYVVSVAVGYVDGRPVEELPEPWELTAPGADNEHSLDRIAAHVRAMYQNELHSTIKEKSR